MRVSILHRVTGNGLAFVGLATLLCWLAALAGGPVAYAKFAAVAGSIPGKLVLVGLSWAFFNHFCSGIRHFVLDMGAGFELERNQLWSILTPLIAILLTIAFWAVMLHHGA